jgi:putative Mn2+ efflux pump MntP
MLAFAIMFFCIAFLCFMLGWADGVRHDKTYLHIPETGGFLVATAVLAALGVIFLVGSRAGKRSRLESELRPPGD